MESAMGSVVDVSDRLGTYMLQGWILTEKSCPTPGCSVPMMRSPNGRIPITHFCANCDDRPSAPQPKPSISISDTASTRTSGSRMSRSSTPPTEVSNALSSPVFAPPADTEESRRRREQSDRASSEIGKRLLKGWAMLGDECTNSGCYGVPLVRPPKAGGEKDPRKECVICGNIYLTEVDWAGRERLIPAVLRPASPDVSGVFKLRENPEAYEEPSFISDENKQLAPSTDIINESGSLTTLGHSHTIDNTVHTRHVQRTLEGSSKALQSTLHMLTAHISTLSSTSDGRTVDLPLIGSTADAIGKVTQALSYVRQLQWSENQSQQL